MVMTTQLKHPDFVTISDEVYHYYGGDQAWYRTDHGIEGGCGPVAASNILAYYAATREPLGSLYLGNHEQFTKNEFLSHMEEVSHYLRPIKIPRPIVGLKVKGFKVPITLGVPTLTQFAQGVVAFASAKGVTLKPHKCNRSINPKRAVDFIKHALSQDAPVALLNYMNPAIQSVPFTNAKGTCSHQSLEMHWVTITALHEDPTTHQTTIEVSTWGGKASVNLKALVGAYGFGGLVYFDVG